jgi:hypothetical protein
VRVVGDGVAGLGGQREVAAGDRLELLLGEVALVLGAGALDGGVQRLVVALGGPSPTRGGDRR